MDTIFTREFIENEPELAKQLYNQIKEHRKRQEYLKVYDAIHDRAGRYGSYIENPTEQQQQEAKAALLSILDYVKELPVVSEYNPETGRCIYTGTRVSYINIALAFYIPLLRKDYCTACEKLIDYWHSGCVFYLPWIKDTVIMSLGIIERGEDK